MYHIQTTNCLQWRLSEERHCIINAQWSSSTAKTSAIRRKYEVHISQNPLQTAHPSKFLHPGFYFLFLCA